MTKTRIAAPDLPRIDDKPPEWTAYVVGSRDPGMSPRASGRDEGTAPARNSVVQQHLFEIVEVLAALVESHGVAAFIATHDAVPLAYADQVFSLVDGRLSVGDPRPSA